MLILLNKSTISSATHNLLVSNNQRFVHSFNIRDATVPYGIHGETQHLHALLTNYKLVLPSVAFRCDMQDVNNTSSIECCCSDKIGCHLAYVHRGAYSSSFCACAHTFIQPQSQRLSSVTMFAWFQVCAPCCDLLMLWPSTTTTPLAMMEWISKTL